MNKFKPKTRLPQGAYQKGLPEAVAPFMKNHVTKGDRVLIIDCLEHAPTHKDKTAEVWGFDGSDQLVAVIETADKPGKQY